MRVRFGEEGKQKRQFVRLDIRSIIVVAMVGVGWAGTMDRMRALLRTARRGSQCTMVRGKYVVSRWNRRRYSTGRP